MKTSCPKSKCSPYKSAKSRIPETITMQVKPYLAEDDKLYQTIVHPLYEPGQTRRKSIHILSPMKRSTPSRRPGGYGWGQISYNEGLFVPPPDLKAGDFVKISRWTVNRSTGRYYNVGNIDRYYKVTSVSPASISMTLSSAEEIP